MEKRYYDMKAYFTDTFGCRVQKISLDAGLTCPNRDGTLSTLGCVYCNPKGSGTGAMAKGLSIREQMLKGKVAIEKRYKAKKFIAYFQAFTNTYAPLSVLKELYEQALSVEGAVGLSIGTRPDCVNTEILDLLGGYAKKYLVWLEYGLQSIHDKSLAKINRGHDFKCFEEAVAATRGRGIKICAHVILGLPGETKKEMLQTAEKVAQMGLDAVKLHLLYVIKNTPLEEAYEKGLYQCLTQEEYVQIVCDFLERLPEDMVIQRLTGEPHAYELVAPKWTLEKRKTLDMIESTLLARDSRQGLLHRH